MNNGPFKHSCWLTSRFNNGPSKHSCWLTSRFNNGPSKHYCWLTSRLIKEESLNMAFLEMLQHIATHHVINFRCQKQTNNFSLAGRSNITDLNIIVSGKQRSFSRLWNYLVLRCKTRGGSRRICSNIKDGALCDNS